MNIKDYIFILSLFVIAIFISLSPTSKPEFTKCVDNEVEIDIPEFLKPVIVIDTIFLIPNLTKTQYELFLDAIGFKESGNNYNIINKFGYMGKYQFGRATLKGLKIDVNRQEFLSNPLLQEQAMYLLLTHNKKKLKRYINKYEGQVIYGVLITESGILAAAHLAGQGNVRKFFRNGYEFKDGFGTSITSYMEEFGGYDLSL